MLKFVIELMLETCQFLQNVDMARFMLEITAFERTASSMLIMPPEVASITSCTAL